MRKSFIQKLTATLLVCFMLCGTAYATVNMTKYIKNPSFEQGTDNWTVTNMNVQSSNNYFKKLSGKSYLEKWTDVGGAVGSASVTQKIADLPAGNYILTVAAHNIQQRKNVEHDGVGDGIAQTGASIYAVSTSNSTVVSVADDYEVAFSVTGSTVTIGFRAVNASGNWVCVDNFRLTFVNCTLEQLQSSITDAEKVITTSQGTSYSGIQPTPLTTLQTAITNAKAATEESTDEELQQLSFALTEAIILATENMNQLKSIFTVFKSAKSYLTKDMPASYLTELQEAYAQAEEALKVESDMDLSPISERLTAALEKAKEATSAKSTLASSIRTANSLVGGSRYPEGQDALISAINEAQAVFDNPEATIEQLKSAKVAIDEAVLMCRIANPTGKANVAKTLSVIEGATEIFARGSFTGSATAKETGFCYGEDPEPTYFDNRSTKVYTDNGAPGSIYVLEDVKPATIYYVRAYVLTSGYQLSYGDVVKVATKPMGNVTFSYGNEGDDASNQRIYAACDEAVWMWNNIGGIRDFYLNAHYRWGAGASGGTAECSYGGYMSVSQTTSYQRTGTILHEGSHGLGVIGGDNWTEYHCGWHSDIYRENYKRGLWLGPRVDRVVQFLENSSTAHLSGDYQHMWPYGINGAHEDTGKPMLYRGNALIVSALMEDGLRQQGVEFARPAYSFTQDDDTRYYIKSESENFGLATSYLRQKDGNKVRFEAMTADEAFSEDSCAWYISYNPKTCYYSFKNVATGKCLSMTTSTVSAANNPTYFQLMGARAQTTVGDFTFAGTSYWMVHSSNHNAMNATATGAASATFNHANSSITQRWLFLTGDEVARFAEAQGETVGIKAIDNNFAASSLRAMGGHGAITIAAIGEGQSAEIYSLDGRLVKRLYVQLNANVSVRVPRGLYIVNGQKVLVK